MIKDKEVWPGLQLLFNDDETLKFSDPISTAKFVKVTACKDRVYRMVRDVGVKVPYGTDKLWDAELPDGQAQALFHCAPAAEIDAFDANLDLMAHPENTCVIAMKQGSA